MKFVGLFVCLALIFSIALVQSMSVGLNDDHPHGIADHKHNANCNGGRGGRGGGGGGGGTGTGGTGTGGTFPNFFNGTLPPLPTRFPNITG